MKLQAMQRAAVCAANGVVCLAAALWFQTLQHKSGTAQAAALNGAAAIQQLKTAGAYDSLAAAFAAVRQQSAITEQTNAVTSNPLLAQQAKLVASDGAASDLLGAAVALSGDTAVVGAPSDDVAVTDQGSAYVFVRSGTGWSLQQKLTLAGGFANDHLGSAVAISGDTVVLGAPNCEVRALNQGIAVVFVRTNAIWSVQATLFANDGLTNDVFGAAVAISGDTVTVGAPYHRVGAKANQGAAYVFIRANNQWAQQQMLTASDGEADDVFGSAVALGGDTLAVGAPFDSTGRNEQQGSAYLFTRNGTVWTQRQKLLADDGASFDRFGVALALGGDTLVVGAPNKASDTKFANTGQGAAYVFIRANNQWTQQQRLVANDGAAYDAFGTSVAVSGDVIAIGAPFNAFGTSTNQGTAYVFARNGSAWTQQRLLTGEDSAPNDSFGAAVALNGDTLVTGAVASDSGAQANQGAAYVFVICANNFVQQQRLAANNGTANDQFGYAVALSGDTMVVGAPFADLGKNTDQGAVYVFVRNGTVWTLQQQLIANDGAAGDGFGGAVAISGDTVLVGAAGHDIGVNANQGAAYVFIRSGPPQAQAWNQQQKLSARDGKANARFGYAVALSGDTAVAGAYGDDIGKNARQGSTYIFNRNGAVWTLQQKLTASDGTANAEFGSAVAISGDTVAVGAPSQNLSAVTKQGAVYVFVPTDGVWAQQQRLVPSDAAFQGFGFSVALSGDTVAVGVLDDNSYTPGSEGAAYVFTRNGTASSQQWTQQQKLSANDGAFHNYFSTSVAVSGDTIAVGAFFDTVGANAAQGAAYVFTRSGSVWTRQQRLSVSDGAVNDFFGLSVAVNSSHVVAGAPVNSGPAAKPGSAYIFACAACPALTLNPTTLPNGVINAAYSQTVLSSGGSGGTGTYQFSLSDGALPPGLALTQSGVLAGKTTTTGTYRFTITATSLESLCPGSRAYTLTINAATVSCVSAASFLPGAAPESIVAAFGVNLAAQTQAAASVPLPTTLAGVSVRVRDSAGVERLAPLFFVSPQQINLQIPTGTANGAATLTLSTGATGTLNVARTAPGLFTANANGQGVPAAVVLRVRANGAQSFEPLARLENNRFVPAPIDLGAAGEQVFLVLFGTGLRFQQTVTASVGGTPAEVLFTGAVTGLAGLDQVNLALPRTLLGRGEVDVTLRVDGANANAVRVSVR